MLPAQTSYNKGIRPGHFPITLNSSLKSRVGNLFWQCGWMFSNEIIPKLLGCWALKVTQLGERSCLPMLLYVKQGMAKPPAQTQSHSACNAALPCPIHSTANWVVLFYFCSKLWVTQKHPCFSSCLFSRLIYRTLSLVQETNQTDQKQSSFMPSSMWAEWLWVVGNKLLTCFRLSSLYYRYSNFSTMSTKYCQMWRKMNILWIQ